MEAQVKPWDSATAERAVAVLKAVADPTRYRLLWALGQREHSVGQLAEMVGAHVAAVSQHLSRLRTAGLVASRREGTRIYYRAAGPHARGLLEEASLAASAPADATCLPDDVREEPAAAPERAVVAVPARRARRPVTEQ
ncbi:metalloregulator ArsR/SmtB family transcription factor [Actinacidiphila oryziradicis]|jgi:DNA-binding transcriptional ArsR family regulator|uniref:ArsR/SmtB family transcription factor n=1 Tax=Actinacidiphila oryziradicis TaxID=2571141 RepID=UPI0023F37392|nr:metalloregulator ArsR/SmtB family transcription factor [Actinacidiphila oryziradicis]MCW2869478.1 putative ArsR family transcriptional regulator [Actinacidiphila oryziradicis]